MAVFFEDSANGTTCDAPSWLENGEMLHSVIELLVCVVGYFFPLWTILLVLRGRLETQTSLVDKEEDEDGEGYEEMLSKYGSGELGPSKTPLGSYVPSSVLFKHDVDDHGISEDEYRPPPSKTPLTSMFRGEIN